MKAVKTRAACEGASTTTVRRCGAWFERCRECKLEVRCDLVEHGFFGFRAACSPKLRDMRKQAGK